MDSTALERFLDDRLGQKLREGLAPGAVFVLVQDGRVILSKGFGVANIATREPVIPERTMFFAGSISKLITATAVTQLADRGLVDLDADVNRYLSSFAIDATYEEPVTLRHLLTHTSGLDRRDIGLATRERTATLPLRVYLNTASVPLVDRPGSAFRYSNRGIAVAGLVVEEVSGQPFAEYVRDHIFVPLGMHGSTMDMLVDDTNLAPGYDPVREGGGWRARSQMYFHNAPAIGLRTTAHDMARFLLAHLNGGALGGQRLLSDSAAAAMQQPQFTPDARLPGSGLGFRYATRMGLLAVGHRGLVNEHASIVDLIPAANAGYFVACNSGDCARLEPLIDELLERFFCGRQPRPGIQTTIRSALTASELQGTYRPRRHAKRNVEKARGLFDEFELRARGETLIVALNIGPRRDHRLVPVGPDEFAHVDTDGRMLLLPATADRRAMFFDGRGLPQEELVRLRPYETRSFFRRMLLASTAGLAAALAVLPIMLIVRRRRSSPGARGVGLAAALCGAVTCAILLVFLQGLQRVLGGAIDSEFVFGMPAGVRALLRLPVIAAVMALPLPALAVALWRRELWTFAERFFYSLMVLGVAALLLLLRYWHLLSLSH